MVYDARRPWRGKTEALSELQGPRQELPGEDPWDYDGADLVFKKVVTAPRITGNMNWEIEKFSTALDDWLQAYVRRGAHQGRPRQTHHIVRPGSARGCMKTAESNAALRRQMSRQVSQARRRARHRRALRSLMKPLGVRGGCRETCRVLSRCGRACLASAPGHL